MAMEIADAELIAEFAIESQEGLANIEQQMLAIEADGAEINVDLVNAVFRTMHSIKGTAGSPPLVIPFDSDFGPVSVEVGLSEASA